MSPWSYFFCHKLFSLIWSGIISKSKENKDFVSLQMAVMTELWSEKTDSRYLSRRQFFPEWWKESNRINFISVIPKWHHMTGFVLSSAIDKLGGCNHINCGEKFMLSKLCSLHLSYPSLLVLLPSIEQLKKLMATGRVILSIWLLRRSSAVEVISGRSHEILISIRCVCFKRITHIYSSIRPPFH